MVRRKFFSIASNDAGRSRYAQACTEYRKFSHFFQRGCAVTCLLFTLNQTTMTTISLVLDIRVKAH